MHAHLSPFFVHEVETDEFENLRQGFHWICRRFFQEHHLGGPRYKQQISVS